jgi:hypothetical protein
VCAARVRRRSAASIRRTVHATAARGFGARVEARDWRAGCDNEAREEVATMAATRRTMGGHGPVPEADETDGAYPRSYPVAFELTHEALGGRRVHFSVLVTRDGPVAEPEADGYVCGRCGRLMADADGWHVLPLPAHLPLPTLVCAPCHAVAAVVH